MAKKNIKKKLNKTLKNIKSNKKLKYVLGLIVLLALLYIFRSAFIAATVNGTPITRFALIKRLESQSGQETLDNLVTKQLILQEAKDKGISISDEVIQQEVEKLRGIVESQGTTLENALALQGQSREGLEENIRLQKTVEELLKEEIKVSEEDARKFFEENKDLYEEGANYEDLKDDIKQQLRQQNIQQEFQSLIEQLRKEANINYFVEF